MRTKSKITALTTGLSLSALMLAMPIVPANAASGLDLTKDSPIKQTILKMDSTSNTAVDVSTELDCNTHTVNAKVTNKTKADITPKVTFNTMPPLYDAPVTIEPGQEGYYQYAYSGNYEPIELTVKVDGQADTVLRSTAICTEPVTFRVDKTSSTAVTGYLQNNSSILPQTVFLRVDNGDIRTETLAAGESRLVALPYKGWPDQAYAYVTVAATGGYEGSYTAALEQPAIPMKTE